MKNITELLKERTHDINHALIHNTLMKQRILINKNNRYVFVEGKKEKFTNSKLSQTLLRDRTPHPITSLLYAERKKSK